MPWKSKNLSEQNFYYYDSDNGKPILFDIHGFGVTAETHLRHASFPLEEHFRLIIPEIPGHGKLVNMEIKSIQNISNYLSTLINHLELENINIIGRSIGGIIVLDLLTDLSLKNRIKHIYIIETPLLGYKESFTSSFRIFEKITAKIPIRLFTPILKILNTSYYEGLKVFIEETRNREVLQILRTLQPIKIEEELIKLMVFIYALNDLYLTNRSIEFVRRLNADIRINQMVGHFKDSTDKSVCDLIAFIAEK